MVTPDSPRFGLVVLGRNNAQPFRELVESYGLVGRLAGIAALEDRLRDPDALHLPVVDAARGLVDQGGAETIILAGAVMAGLPYTLEGRVPVPLVEGIACGVLLAETLVRLGASKPRFGSLQVPDETRGPEPRHGAERTVVAVTLQIRRDLEVEPVGSPSRAAALTPWACLPLFRCRLRSRF